MGIRSKRLWTSREVAELLVSGLLAFGVASAADARPERIRPGISYYSDEFVVRGQIHDLGTERNFEEVYQLYTYYEVIYDESSRVQVFKEYRRGELIRTEEYRYAPSGEPIQKTIRRPGEEAEVTPIDVQ